MVRAEHRRGIHRGAAALPHPRHSRRNRVGPTRRASNPPGNLHPTGGTRVQHRRGAGAGSGALIGLWGPARIAAAPTIGALRAVPSLAWVPLLLLWIGIGENSKVTLVAIGAFFPVYTTVSAALAHVDPKLVEAARAFGYRGVKLFTTVQLPAVLPSVVSGLRLALAQAWLFLVAAELLGASMGLGYLLTDSQNNGRTDRLLLAIVLLAVLGKLTDALIGVFERWVKAKYPSN